MKKNLLDINIYLLGILLDSFGVFILLQASFGASPFGVLISNVVLVVPITLGIASLIYDFFNISVAALLNKKRITFENLIYGVIFAVLLDLYTVIIPSFSHLELVYRLLIMLGGLVILDLAKAILNLSKFPKLSTVVLIYAIHNKFPKLNLNWSSKLLNFNNIFWGIMFSLIAGVPFNNLGWGTLICLLFLGIPLKFFDPLVKKAYFKITK